MQTTAPPRIRNWTERSKGMLRCFLYDLYGISAFLAHLRQDHKLLRTSMFLSAFLIPLLQKY